MTGFSITNYRNYYTSNETVSGFTVRNSCGTVVQPSKTAIKDTYATSEATNTLTLDTYAAPSAQLKLAVPSIQKASSEMLLSKEWLMERQNKITNVKEWALGGDFYEKRLQKFHDNVQQGGLLDSSVLGLGFMANAGGPPLITRSDKMLIQSRLEATGNALNEQIDRVVKASRISFGEKERLNFSIDQYGKISITGGIGDTDSRKQVLEDMLNSDDAIRSNLYLYQAQKNVIADEFGAFDNQQRYLMENAYDWAHGNKTGMLHEDEAWQFRWDAIEFSFQDGKVFQGKDLPEDRVFSNRLDSLADLGKIIGLDESATKDVQSFVAALEKDIASESSKLTGLLNTALKKAGLGDVTKKITFSQDADGSIVIEGNISEKQKKELAKIINDDSKLSELIKTQSAKKAVLAELTGAITDEPVNLKSYGAWKKHNAQAGFDLSKDSLASAREQLLKNFLDKGGVSLSELKADPDAAFAKHGELGEIKGLRNEIANLLTQKTKTTETQPLLAMKRGEIVETAGANERFGIDEGVAELKYRFNAWIKEYNRVLALKQPGLAISDYTLAFDSNGQISFEVKTVNGENRSEQAAKQYLTTHHVKSSSFQELGLAILETHDDEHGDVQEHKHSVIIEQGNDGYRIESEEADQAALIEMEELTKEIDAALGEFFCKMIGTENPFTLTFGSGGLSLGGSSLSSAQSQTVKQMLKNVNHYLVVDQIGKDTLGMLPGIFFGIGKNLVTLSKALDKIHDKLLIPEDGFH